MRRAGAEEESAVGIGRTLNVSCRQETRSEAKGPPRPEPGGAGRRRSMLLIDPIGALAALRFEGLDGVSGLLHRAGHEAADGMLLPAHFLHDLRQRGARSEERRVGKECRSRWSPYP